MALSAARTDRLARPPLTVTWCCRADRGAGSDPEVARSPTGMPISATQAATPRTMPARRGWARARGDPVPSSIHRPPSSEDCPALRADVPIVHGGTPLAGPVPTVARGPPDMRAPKPSYRGCERASRVCIRIRKIRYGVSDQGEIDLSVPEESGPLSRLEQDPGGRPTFGGVLAEAGFEHRGERVGVPELPARCILEDAVEERHRPARFGQGRPAHPGIVGEAAAPAVGEDDLTRSARDEPEEAGVGQAAQKGPVADAAVREGRGEAVGVRSSARSGHGARQCQRGVEAVGHRAVERACHA